MHAAYCTDIRHRHCGGMLNKTPPPTELQIPATVTTLFKQTEVLIHLRLIKISNFHETISLLLLQNHIQT